MRVTLSLVEVDGARGRSVRGQRQGMRKAESRAHIAHININVAHAVKFTNTFAEKFTNTFAVKPGPCLQQYESSPI